MENVQTHVVHDDRHDAMVVETVPDVFVAFVKLVDADFEMSDECRKDFRQVRGVPSGDAARIIAVEVQCRGQIRDLFRDVVGPRVEDRILRLFLSNGE